MATYRNEDVDEKIMIHYRRYSGTKVEESPNKGHCGYFDLRWRV